MPGKADPSFSGTVVYICEHNAQGATGIVINRPTDVNLQKLFSQLGMTLEIAELQAQPTYFGGPLQVERGFVLHELEGKAFTSSLIVPGGLQMTTSKDVLEAIVEGKGPQRFILALGHASWSAGQLEQEIASNGWLTVKADSNVIFEIPTENRFDAALSLLGIERSMLTGEAGHA